MSVDIDTLIRAGKTLDAAGIEWWVVDGTCLSLVRSGRMEEWQQDVDLGVWDIAVAARVMREAGWKDRQICPNQFKSSGKLDIVGHRRAGDQVLVDYLDNVTYGFSARLFDEFGTVTVDGDKFLTPSPVEDYLTEHYGNWRIPVKEWNWKTSPRCVIR
jgi:hypothetical protein